MTIIEFGGKTPVVAESAYVAPGAVLIGDVTIEEEGSVWFNAVLRGDNEPIVVGAHSNVQDGAVCHTDPGFPIHVAPWSTIGHNAILHGCEVGSGVIVGMGATLLNGARVGDGALVAANALVLEEFEVPSGALVAGVPAKVRREMDEEDSARLRRGAEGYVRKSRLYMNESNDTELQRR